MNVSGARQALADAMSLVPTLNAYPTVRDSVSVPAAMVEPTSGQFLVWETQDGARTLRLTVTLLVSRVDSQSGQDVVDGFLDDDSPTSIRQALLDSDDVDAEVVDATNYGILTHGGVDYYGCQLSVTVLY